MRKIIIGIISFIIICFLILITLIITDSPLLYPLEKNVSVIVQTNDYVTYYEIDNSPEYIEEYMCHWFDDALSPITKYKLKNYMKDNNLVIISGEYNFKNTVRFEEIIKILKFKTG